MEAPLPANEATRVASLRDLNVLYTPAEERFDRITRLACRLLDVPIALVSLVDSECQWFKSSKGLEATETPRAISFCGHAILQSETLVVPDARLDTRFADNPLVVGEPFIRFYAGHPLQAEDGSRIGTLCVIDRQPRHPDASDLENLRDLAGWASNELRMASMSHSQRELIAERDHLRRKSMIDGLTRLWNRQAVLDVLDRELERGSRDGVRLCAILADVDHFKRINDSYGHTVGDAVLCGVAKGLRSALRPYDAVGRYGGEEFLIVLVNCDATEGALIAERIRRRVETDTYETPGGPITATVSLGLKPWNPAERPDRAELIESADRALYRAKAAGRNRVEIASPD